MNYMGNTDYNNAMKLLKDILVRKEIEKKCDISHEFRNVILEIAMYVGIKGDGFPERFGNCSINTKTSYLLLDLKDKLKEFDNDIDVFNTFKDVLNSSTLIHKSLKEEAISMLEKGFYSIYNEEKYNDLIREKGKRKIICLTEEELINIMEAHHRWKWGNHMQFIVEKNIQTVSQDTLHSVKPRYIYRENGSEFYLDENLVKTILCECFEELEIDNIVFNTSYIKHDWVDYTKNVKRDSHGNPADQESMRMMRHPGMYQGGTVSPTFESIVIYAREKEYNFEYKLSL